ncbi:Lcl C-terminal domain-containing protein [Halomonas koreensis]|uniref:DUF1566 domain-containing protein n=1 Tax=Halomonas koreensis TaxID=245385 RepID=A0ABU1G327_9GAMM|nr:hypothetical protein [Halomonas koreensis]MDR5867300.1 hypothetical protein [Halomonas koreensis]
MITNDQTIPSLTLEQTADGQNPVVTASITDSAGSVDELRLYRSETPMDPQALPAPIVVLGAAAVSHDDDTVAIDTNYYYRVASVEGGLVRLSAEASVAVVETLAPDYANASVGDEIGGGIYAGTITYADARQFHIIAAKSAGESGSMRWSFSSSGSGITAEDPDDGYQNTQEALGFYNSMPAIEHCLDYTNDGFDDWYMPSENELNLVVQNLSIPDHPEFSINNQLVYRWSSTMKSSDSALTQRFSDGVTFNQNVTQDRPVRPVRRVPV